MLRFLLLFVLGSLGVLTPVAQASIVINEVLAFNRNAHANAVDFPDVIELFNTGSTSVDVSGYSITDDPLLPAKFTIPSTTIIAAGGYLVIYADSAFTSPGLHTGFGLSSDGDRVLLFNGSTRIDSVTFGPQAPDVSIGRTPNGTGSFQANTPSVGSVNVPITLASPTKLKINEYMANPAYGADWFELYNTDANPVSLAGLWLSDNAATPRVNQLPPLSFIAGRGHQRFWADDSLTGGVRMRFQLKALGDSIVLTQSNGTTTIDRITFGTQALDVSQGRLPDGASTIVSMPQCASPENPNYLNTSIVINEVLANAAPPLEDAIELSNVGTAPVNVGGWWLSDDLNVRRKYQIPANTIIPPGGFLVVYEQQMQSGLIPFSLLARGDEVFLSAVNSSGNLTGFGALVRFGPATTNTSIGRVTATGLSSSSGGAEFWRLSAPSFGQDNPPSTTVFRSGSGLPNAAPRAGPVIINEIMYRPPERNALDDAVAEFIELYNITNAPIDLSGWRLKGDVEYLMPDGASIPPRGFILLVSFDPTVDSDSLDLFRSTYGLSAGSPAIYGPYSDRLSNATMSVEFANPITIGSNTLFANTDKVEYRDLAPWPTSPDGTGHSLQRSNAFVIGNTASNWTGDTATPGAVNRNVVSTLSITTPSNLPGGVVGEPYSSSLQAAEGFTPFAWIRTSGALPPSVSLTSGGQLTGSPGAAGSFTFTAQVTDARGFTRSKTFTVIIAATRPAITTPSPLPDTLTGTPLSQTLAASGGTPPFTWSVAIGSLPPGVALSPSGSLTGLPSTPGTFNFTLRIDDSGGLSATQALAITINPSPITILTSSPLPGAVRALAYTQPLTATGGSPPYQWSLFSGSLPVGLSLNPNGTLTGTPTTPSVTNFIAQLTDSTGLVAAKAFVLTVHPRRQIPVMNPATLPSIQVGSLFNHPFSAVNYPQTYSATGLPAGLKLNPSTGVVSGRPTVSGSFTLRVRASNSAGTSAILSAPLVITPLPQNLVGTFTGLVARDPVANGNLGARLTLTTTSRGTYTAKITRGATTISAPVGYLNLSPPQVTTTLGGQPLSLTLDPHTNLLSGAHGPASVSGWRSTWSRTTPATNRVGYYSFALDLASSGDQGAIAIPQGSGYAAVSVSASGALTLAGRTADGSAITTSSFIGPSGQIAVHASLYAHRGSLTGFLDLVESTPGTLADNTLLGSLTWLKPATTSRTYKSAFGPVNLTATGRYLAPSKTGFVILGLPAPGTAFLDFTEAGTSPSATNPDVTFTYTAANIITLPTFVSGANPGRTTLSITKTTGALSGSFTLTDTSPPSTRTVRFQGLIVRPATGPVKARGYFLLPQIPVAGETNATSPILSGKVELLQP